MPYRIDIAAPPPDALDRLVTLGALDVEQHGGRLAALLPDRVTREALVHALGGAAVTFSVAVGRDADSVWVLAPRPVRVGRLLIAPEGTPAEGALRLLDTTTFGSGMHPTTVLCLEALEEALTTNGPARVLDVGTGSGVLALAALRLGAPQATGLDIDQAALDVAQRNAALNGLAARLTLTCGGPDAVTGMWPVVVANVLPAPLMEMAPTLARRLGHRARLILSGIPASLATEVLHAYQHQGLRPLERRTRHGWSALVLEASW